MEPVLMWMLQLHLLGATKQPINCNESGKVQLSAERTEKVVSSEELCELVPDGNSPKVCFHLASRREVRCSESFLSRVLIKLSSNGSNLLQSLTWWDTYYHPSHFETPASQAEALGKQCNNDRRGKQGRLLNSSQQSATPVEYDSGGEVHTGWFRRNSCQCQSSASVLCPLGGTVWRRGR